MSAADRTGVLHLHTGRTPRLPRDAFGRRASPSGRALLLDAARGGDRSAGRPAGAPVHGPDRRWYWPGTGWRGSVSHVGEAGLAGLAHDVWIGVDIQDERPRPAALRWLARVLDRPVEQVTLRDWAETEALLKAQGIAGTRPERVDLPPWEPGWRPTRCGWWVRSSPTAPGGVHLALAAQEPLPLRWSGDRVHTRPTERSLLG